MKAYKCDRCGKLFEQYKNQGTARFLNITRNPNFTGGCLDLCPKCNAELQSWVDNDDCDCAEEDNKEKIDGAKSRKLHDN